MISKVQKLETQVKELKRLEYEKIFVNRWGSFNTMGLTTKECKPIMDSFVKDYVRAFNKHPDWFAFWSHVGTIRVTQNEIDRINVNAFRVLFKDGVGI